ncbi:MAG: hypothetical protein ABFC94_00205 [Syntrophomonas sp.]
MMLKHSYSEDKVYLYGSLTWGWFTRGSDIDPMVEGLDADKYFKAWSAVEKIVAFLV